MGDFAKLAGMFSRRQISTPRRTPSPSLSLFPSLSPFPFLLSFLFSVPVLGQTFNLVGDAIDLGGGCYRMTPAMNTQNGGVWCEQTLDLTEPFDLAFQLYFGFNDGGADGLVFVLQDMGLNAAGTGGGGIGYQDIAPSFGVEFDTWQNGQFADPWFDHIGFISGGSTNHNPPSGLGGPVQANPTNTNIEDGADHPVRIIWEPASQMLSVLFDCELRLAEQVDLPAIIGTTDVIWGFVASTGGANNEQRFCLDSADLVGESATVAICEGEAVTLEPLTETGGVGYVWEPAVGLDNPVAENPVCSAVVPTMYVVTYPLCLDTGSDTIYVEMHPDPPASFALIETSSCEFPVDLEIVNTSPPDPTTTYTWTLNGVGLGTGEEPASAVATGPGSWVVAMEAESAVGCTAEATADFQVFEPVTAVVDWWPVAGCSPLDVEFTDASINALTTQVQVRPEGGAWGPPAEADGLEVQMGQDGAWDVWVEAVSPDGCVDTVGGEVEVWPLPSAEFSSSPLFGSADSPDGLNDFWTFTNFSSGAISSHWDFGDGSSSDSWETSHTFSGGDYAVTLTVVSAAGCTDSETAFIRVVPNLFVYIPAAFTPDMDGNNDGWRPELSDYSIVREYELVLLDRWGQVVWRTEDPQATWVGESQVDGSYFAPDGAYGYVLRILTTLGGDKHREFTGAVSLLR